MVDIDSGSSPNMQDRSGSPKEELRPFDKLAPEMREVLDELKRLGARPLSQLSVEEARAQPGPVDAAKSLEFKRGLDCTAELGISAEDLVISSPNGCVRARVYKPDGDNGPHPAVIYFHSGGFVIGNIDVYDQTARRLALHAGAIVLAVD